MDTFEAIRESAARLNGELVQSGADPLDPIALTDAAIRRLDLTLAWIAHGDPALKGSRALFDEQSGTICCETSGGSVERCLLVAHELGHSVVHSGSTSCAEDDIEPSRSIEAAPVGLQRVEDYGARERRELQANVFAREFVLPRTLARRLHIDELMGARAIAARTGLPINLIRQQLLDALLLPPASKDQEIEFVRTARRLDPSQDRAAGHSGSAFLLQAGPGTGKTRTLVNRVLALISGGVAPASILVLTFSNRAAGELAERITDAVPEAAPRIWIGTFHSFGLDLVRRYHDRLGLSPNPVLFDRSDAIEVLEEILPTLPLKHYRNLWDPAMVLRDLVNAIGRAKDELAYPVRYRALANAMLDGARDEGTRIEAEKCLEIAHIYDLYEQAMSERGAVDFGDLIMRPTLLLESEPALRLAVQLRHRHLLVDEYQDVNRASARLLKVVAGDGNRLWVVGDSRQSIYRFRGASSTNMVAFPNDYADTRIDQLSINYRSTEQIVHAFTAVASRMGASEGMLPLALTADRGHGAVLPEIRRYETLTDEEDGIAASVRELEARGVTLRDQAVLCRSNRRLNEIASSLEAHGIPVLHLGSLFEREEIRDLLALLSLAVDPFGEGLTRVGAMPRYDLSLQDVYAVTQYLRSMARPVLDDLAALSRATGISPLGCEGLARLAQDLDGISRNSSAWDFLATYLFDRTNLARSMALLDTVADRMRAVAIWQFLNFVREQSPAGSGLPIQRTLNRVRQLVLLAEERDLRQVPSAALHMDAVRLMTVHGSKGLEFEAVHVPSLTVSSFPSSNRGQRCPPPVGMIEGTDAVSVYDEAKRAHDHEEECLFFVAISRARTYLRLHLSKRQANGSNRSASPFLDWLPSRLVNDVSTPRTLPPSSTLARMSSITFTTPADWRITDSSLGLYEKCPRRFFYTHVLRLGGGRKATAFSRTHDCLYDLIRWFASVRCQAEPTVEEAEDMFESIWQVRGPVEHAFADEYRRLASQMISALVRSGAGRRFHNTEPIVIDFPNGRVVVEPNELAELPNGSYVMRRIRTGSKRSDEDSRLEYTLYHLAGQSQFRKGFSVEAVHLTDELVDPIMVTARKMDTRRAKANEMLSAIARGQFPPDIDAVRCPRCPHFFICAATPKGPLTLAE